MKREYIIAGILLAIPTLVLLPVEYYNVKNPEISGLPFFYWYQLVWLGFATVLYLVAVVFIGKAEEDKGGRTA